MNNNKQTVKPFLKLKGNYGDVYSIDKMDDDTLVISPLKPQIDIFKTLTLRDTDSNELCSINISELLINALIENIERTQIGGAKEKTMVEIIKEGGMKAINEFINCKIVFREMAECFPPNTNDNRKYAPPNSDKIKDDRKNSTDITDSLMAQIKAQKESATKKESYVRETPKVGVNDPCPCGSGLKYKKCCKDKESSSIG